MKLSKKLRKEIKQDDFFEKALDLKLEGKIDYNKFRRSKIYRKIVIDSILKTM